MPRFVMNIKIESDKFVFTLHHIFKKYKYKDRRYLSSQTHNLEDKFHKNYAGADVTNEVLL
jgi:hypothetical protein